MGESMGTTDPGKGCLSSNHKYTSSLTSPTMKVEVAGSSETLLPIYLSVTSHNTIILVFSLERTSTLTYSDGIG
jgi:hypothetical protein